MCVGNWGEHSKQSSVGLVMVGYLETFRLPHGLPDQGSHVCRQYWMGTAPQEFIAFYNNGSNLFSTKVHLQSSKFQQQPIFLRSMVFTMQIHSWTQKYISYRKCSFLPPLVSWRSTSVKILIFGDSLELMAFRLVSILTDKPSRYRL